jgi:NitT/TauT family transport system ATP-binding protein
MEFIDLVGLRGFEHHHPGELSGGNESARRHCAGAVDEPARHPEWTSHSAALDAQTKLEMQEEPCCDLAEAPLSIVFVTHSVDEALVLGNKIVVMTRRPGRIRESVAFDLPRPRDITSPEFQRRQAPRPSRLSAKNRHASLKVA